MLDRRRQCPAQSRALSSPVSSATAPVEDITDSEDLTVNKSSDYFDTGIDSARDLRKSLSPRSHWTYPASLSPSTLIISLGLKNNLDL